MPHWIYWIVALIVFYFILELIKIIHSNRTTIQQNLRRELRSVLRGALNLQYIAIIALLFLSIYSGWKLFSKAATGYKSEMLRSELLGKITSDVAGLSKLFTEESDLNNKASEIARRSFILRHAEKLYDLESQLETYRISQIPNIRYELISATIRVKTGSVKMVKIITGQFTEAEADSNIQLALGGRVLMKFQDLNARVCFQVGKNRVEEEFREEERFTIDSKELIQYLMTYEQNGILRKASAEEALKSMILKVPLPRKIIDGKPFKLALMYEWIGFDDKEPLTIIGITPSLYNYAVDKFSYEVIFESPLLYFGFLSLGINDQDKKWAMIEPDIFSQEFQDNIIIIKFEFTKLSNNIAFLFEQSP